jgi:hypothetical protein
MIDIWPARQAAGVARGGKAPCPVVGLQHPDTFVSGPAKSPKNAANAIAFDLLGFLRMLLTFREGPMRAVAG